MSNVFVISIRTVSYTHLDVYKRQSLNDDLIELRTRVKEQDKEIRRLKKANEFLEAASAFFAASRRKSVKNRD